jgi:hypothetical protein
MSFRDAVQVWCAPTLLFNINICTNKSTCSGLRDQIEGSNPTAGSNERGSNAQADDDDYEGDVAGPRVLANVTLAKTIRT